MSEIPRREFLADLGVFALALAEPRAMFGSDVSTDELQERLAQANGLLRRFPAFDCHTHPGLFPLKDIPNSANPREYFGDDVVATRIENMRNSHMGGGFFTMVLDAPLLGGRRGKVRSFEPGEGWREYKRQLGLLEAMLERHAVTKAVTANALEAAHSSGEVAAIFACEGGDHLQGDPGRVEEAYEDGIRHIQLYHVASNELVLTDERGRDNGLSDVGREVVREMNRLGMVIDLGHASFATTRDVAELSDDPVLYSHSLILRPGARGFGMSLDQARLVVETGGVIGAFGGTPNRDIPGYVDNILYMVEAVGVDHVALGSDMDGTGGRSVWDSYAQVPEIVAGLLTGGLSEAETSKIIGGNPLRVLREVAT